MFKKLLFLTCILINIVHAEPDNNPETTLETTAKAKPKGLFTKLKNHNIATIEWEDEDWDTDDYMVYLNHIMENDISPTPHRKRSRAFQFMEEHEKRVNLVQTHVIDKETWHDLNLFAGKKDLSVYLCSKIDRTQTELGKVIFFSMIANPTNDVTQITKTQNIIKTLVSDQKRLDLFRQKIANITTSENVLLSFWGRDSFKQPLKREYFDYSGFDNERLNNNEALLELKSLSGHGSRIGGICSTTLTSLVLCTYGTLILTDMIKIPDWLKNWANRSSGSGGPLFSLLSFFENKWVHGTSSIASGVFCGLTLKDQIHWTQGNILLENCVQQKLMHVAKYLSCMKELHALSQNPVLRENFPGLANIEKLFTTLTEKSEKLNELLALLQTETFEGEPSFFSDKGNILLAYKLMHDVKKDLEDAIVTVATIDAYVSIAQLYKEFETKSVKFCFAQFIDTQTPFIELNNFWNPFVDPEKVIANSMTLGKTPASRNVIVTGPNAGGKSTILKAIAVNLILAQSIGIAPSESLTLTPLSKISTYLNISDDIAVGNSLFKSEVLRAQNLITTIQNQKDREFTFTIFDEIFSGTSPKEGEAAAFSVAKHLGEFKNNMSVIATHFPLLTTLEKVSPYFSNYKVSVHHLRDGNISYPFKLEPGISDQHIAIDILRIEGFNTTILDDAHAIINKR